ncbi:uncharacterized protein LOC110924256 [Helianthus annuus]|uniref:uncharacterized protein LOC110924256 n=1 Tax=Helianthus annuus TaxID=4232 RepID=UPI000B8F26E2|nr:uncharacterized protein LOC110924256 [Helianthus annuus]
MLRAAVGNGESIRFRIDVWCGEMAFKDKFPNLFKIKINKVVLVSERLQSVKEGTVCWKIRSANMSQVLQNELDICISFLAEVLIVDSQDKWVWSDDDSDMFSVISAKKWLQQETSNSAVGRLEWCKWIPAKVNIFVWRAKMDRIATISALERRNIMIPSRGCVFCEYSPETTDHLFSGCFFSNGIWLAIESWCRIPNVFAFSIRDLVNLHNSVGFKGIKKVAFQGIIYIALWSIWRARNDRVFADKRLKVMEVMAEIKSLSFLWFRCRYNTIRILLSGNLGVTLI